jgi:ribosomal protein S18 acetylase RimI-like enzyme
MLSARETDGPRTIRELNAAEARTIAAELTLLLQDTVESGASIGFIPPVQTEEGSAYWSGVFAAMEAGDRILCAAFAGDRLVGAVQLGLEMRPNGLHRAEVMKLMVHRSARRHGIGRELMLHVEAVARRLKRTLLVLDTRSGDAAEQLYLRLGYTRAGSIPAYARSASGELHATVFLYKQLDA